MPDFVAGRVDEAINRLGAEDRAAILLRFFEGDSPPTNVHERAAPTFWDQLVWVFAGGKVAPQLLGFVRRGNAIHLGVGLFLTYLFCQSGRMKRTPANGPTRQTASEEPRVSEDRVSEELEGFVELGMKREALRLARACLKRKSVRAEGFAAALEAILIQGDRVRPWRSLVESAYDRMTLRDQQAVRAELLGFYVSLKDWIAAARFIPGRFRHASELLFVMWTLLNLRKMDEAKLLHRKCRRALAKTEEPLEQSSLLEALASYHAQAGQLSVAEHYWERSATLESLTHNALAGLVKLQSVRGLCYLAAGRMQVEEFRKQWDPTQEITLPGNRTGALDEVEEDLNAYQKALEKIVPASELWQFGFETNPGGNDLTSSHA